MGCDYIFAFSKFHVFFIQELKNDITACAILSIIVFKIVLILTILYMYEYYANHIHTPISFSYPIITANNLKLLNFLLSCFGFFFFFGADFVQGVIVDF